MLLQISIIILYKKQHIIYYCKCPLSHGWTSHWTFLLANIWACDLTLSEFFTKAPTLICLCMHIHTAQTERRTLFFNLSQGSSGDKSTVPSYWSIGISKEKAESCFMSLQLVSYSKWHSLIELKHTQVYNCTVQQRHLPHVAAACRLHTVELLH